MSNDRYLRILLTVIASALVYLCLVLTPWPTLSAQTNSVGVPVPGQSTGPAEVVIVGWKASGQRPLPVEVVGRIGIAGDVTVVGHVETRQASGTTSRVVLAGWEPDGPAPSGSYTHWDSPGKGLPVTAR